MCINRRDQLLLLKSDVRHREVLNPHLLNRHRVSVGLNKDSTMNNRLIMFEISVERQLRLLEGK